ncbi:MAG: hypothetical protein LBK61_00155 [Spirochaetaceae bacterium]|jgi:hypothetical protein|nr:hypothetical protein [Spirochaetaceae bacterium]
MAIQPLDLQIMFSQLDKVGKEQSALREGAAIQKAAAGDREAQKLTQTIESVNAAAEGNDPENAGNHQLERLREREGRGGKKDHAPHDTAQTVAGPAASGQNGAFVEIADPMVGKHIDLEG